MSGSWAEGDFMGHEGFERSPMRVVSRYLEEGLAAGQLGVISARAGVGKSTLLVHIGLDALLRGVSVLHVSMRDTVDHVRAYYDEIFQALAQSRKGRERTEALVAAERHRMIHSYLERSFSVEQLRANMAMLEQVAQFRPDVLLVDGFDEPFAREHLANIAALAKDRQVAVWFTLRRPPEGVEIDEWLAQFCSLGLRLVPHDRNVRILLKRPSAVEPLTLPVTLDPTTMLVLGEGERGNGASLLTPRATDCTLYSGGANGAEAEFGAHAETWGVNEVNFTFDGHNQVRGRGRYELSPRELAAGDVSLVYVSRRLNRTYSEGSLIRRVLQTIWHMVSRSQQVFVIGSVQEDGTVKGGTGWSVELARMWNKNLWVFDQDTDGWFRWDGHEWVKGSAVIETIHFTGTGTRYLNDAGRKAIHDLFERSFSRRTEGE